MMRKETFKVCVVVMAVVLFSNRTSCNEGTTETVSIKVSVDSRVELMSIIYRLAGHNEYNQPTVKGPYVRDVEKHFGPYKNHCAVKYAAKLGGGYGFDKPDGLGCTP